MLRQGDVLLVPSRVPEAARTKRRSGDVILALGEATGHAHRIRTAGVRVYEHEGTRWIRVPRPAEITHEEHCAITVAPGEYEVRIQRVYTPEEVRRVQD